MADNEKKEGNPLDSAKDALSSVTKAIPGLGGGKEGGGGIMDMGKDMLHKATDMLDPSKAMDKLKDLTKGMTPPMPGADDTKDKEKVKPK